MRLKLIFLISLTSLLLSGCVATSNVKRESQPLELVPARCNSANLPPKLSCIEGSQFERGDAFEACRLSVEIYLGALDRVYECSYDALSGHYAALKQAVSTTYDCYIQAYNGTGNSSDCAPVEPPTYQLFTEIDGIAPNWGIPECVSSTSLLRNPENLNPLQLDLCQLEINSFMSDSLETDGPAPFGASSADLQFNDYMINLQKRIQADANETISQFNCKGLAGQDCELLTP